MLTWKEKLRKMFSWTEYKKDCAMSNELTTGTFLCPDCSAKMLERNDAPSWNAYRYTTIAAFIALIWILARWTL